MDQRGYALIRGEGWIRGGMVDQRGHALIRGEGWIRGGMLLLEGRGGSEGVCSY